jgi:hypothetical protein
LAFTLANLAFSAMEFRKGWEDAGEWDNLLANLKWGSDWLMKAHVEASDIPSENKFVGQVRAAWHRTSFFRKGSFRPLG